MRTNLNVPFTEKDEARRLGARWDIARRVWYIEDVDDMAPFLRWFPAHLTRPHGGATATRQEPKAKPTRKPAKPAQTKNYTRPQGDLFGPVIPPPPACGCPPWEDCPACRLNI